jgi:hypothetical protein
MYSELAPPSTVHLSQRGNVEHRQEHLDAQGDEEADLELFLRAIEQRDELAWEQIYQRWKGLLLHWLFRHPLARLALEQWSSEDYITLALGKFWQAVTHSSRDKPIFSTRPALLAYLRSCLNSVVFDAVREADVQRCNVCLSDVAEEVVSSPLEVDGGELWRSIEQVLPGRRERLLVYLRYVQGERPREVVATHPQEFPNVQEVYRLERNILNRLRGHPALVQYLSCGTGC